MANEINAETLLVQMRAMAAQAQGKSTTPVESDLNANFVDLLKQSVDKVNQTQQQATKLGDAFQQGDPDIKLSEVMVSLQKANISFQAMLQVRNKLVHAYQEIMNMQI